MQSMLSLLSGAVLIALVYGLSFLPSANLAKFEDEDGFANSSQRISEQKSDAGRDQFRS
jgi:nitrogen fixation-related uncharacterized protein